VIDFFIISFSDDMYNNITFLLLNAQHLVRLITD